MEITDKLRLKFLQDNIIGIYEIDDRTFMSFKVKINNNSLDITEAIDAAIMAMEK